MVVDVRQAALLKHEIEALLAPLFGVDGLYDLVGESMSPGEDDSAAQNANVRPWTLLPLLVCEAVSGRYEAAIPAAAAIHFFTAAGDVLDDIEDADSPSSLAARHGVPLATNTATTLLILAEKAISRLNESGVADSIVVRAMGVVNSYYTVACAGQHLDLSRPPHRIISETEYLKISEMKSATTIQCACHLGALVSSASEHLVDAFVNFGYNLGMASQIANDIRGVTSVDDIIERKMTLPVIYALDHADTPSRSKLMEIFINRVDAVTDHAPIRDLLFRTGAVHYATIRMEMYKQQASGALVAAQGAGANVERLKAFLL